MVNVPHDADRYALDKRTRNLTPCPTGRKSSAGRSVDSYFINPAAVVDVADGIAAYLVANGFSDVSEIVGAVTS